MTQNKAGRYAQYMLKFSPKIRLSMLINVMLIKKKINVTFELNFAASFSLKQTQQCAKSKSSSLFSRNLQFTDVIVENSLYDYGRSKTAQTFGGLIS